MSGAHRDKALQIDDVLRYLDVDLRFKRFLIVWVFGTSGARIRHGETEDEAWTRRWVLYSITALSDGSSMSRTTPR